MTTAIFDLDCPVLAHRQCPGGSDGLMACGRMLRNQLYSLVGYRPLCPECFPAGRPPVDASWIATTHVRDPT